jgi:hypothetical protein
VAVATMPEGVRGLAVDGTSKLAAALDLGPGVLEYVIGLNPHDFARLRNPLMRKLMPKRIRLDRLARMVDKPVSQLVEEIHAAAGLEVDRVGLALIEEPATDVLPSNAERQPDWAAGDTAAVVDLLEGDERLDTDPIPLIHRALARAARGAVVLVKHKWEPQPLYDVWSRTGVEHWAEQRAVDEWWIWLRKA